MVELPINGATKCQNRTSNTQIERRGGTSIARPVSISFPRLAQLSLNVTAQSLPISRGGLAMTAPRRTQHTQKRELPESWPPGSSDWKFVLEASTESRCWKHQVEEFTGSPYWEPPLGSHYWQSLLEASAGSLYRKLPLEASPDWKPPLEASAGRPHLEATAGGLRWKSVLEAPTASRD